MIDIVIWDKYHPKLFIFPGKEINFEQIVK